MQKRNVQATKGRPVSPIKRQQLHWAEAPNWLRPATTTFRNSTDTTSFLSLYPLKGIQVKRVQRWFLERTVVVTEYRNLEWATTFVSHSNPSQIVTYPSRFDIELGACKSKFKPLTMSCSRETNLRKEAG